jgi:hypothetical protein
MDGSVRDTWKIYKNSKINFREVKCEGMNWIELAEDRVQWQTSLDMVMDLRFSSMNNLGIS